MNKRLEVLLHLAGSAIFLLLAFLASPDWPDLDRMLGNPYGLRDLIFQAEILLLFYVNYYFLIDRFYFTRRYFTYFLILLCGFILFIPVTNYLIEYYHTAKPILKDGLPLRKDRLFSIFISLRVYLFLLIVVFSLLLKIFDHLRRVKQEKVSSELAFLKAQINPHFFFNTLNTIYSLSVNRSPNASEAILKLSSMMRYVLRDTEATFVKLDKEIEYIRDYVALQKLRLDDRIKLEFTCEGQFEDRTIAPLILIPYIENAFKFGVSTEEPSTIAIKIQSDDGRITLTVINTKIASSSAELSHTGLGLENAAKRLELLYPGAYDLRVEDKPGEFCVTLSINLG